MNKIVSGYTQSIGNQHAKISIGYVLGIYNFLFLPNDNHIVKLQILYGQPLFSGLVVRQRVRNATEKTKTTEYDII